MLIDLQVVAILILLLACAAVPIETTGGATRLASSTKPTPLPIPSFQITGPTVIAFSVTGESGEKDFETATAADDFSLHLGKAREMLTAAGVTVYQSGRGSFRVVSGTHIRLIHARGRAPVFGCCLVAPNKAPHILYGVQTYSDLFVQACRHFKLASASCR